VIYTEWIFFALLALAVVILRQRRDYQPAWRMPLVPLLPIAFAIVSLLIVANQIRADLTNSAIGLAIVATGIPAYYLWSARK
jgi:amino acid transporter